MISQALLSELKFEADNTKKLFEAIPDDILEYKPNDFNWTMAELASHIAEIYNWWDLTLDQDVLEMADYRYDKGDISSMKAIKKKLDGNIEKALSTLKDYPDHKLSVMWAMKFNGRDLMPPMPRIQVVRSFLMNHLYHHRGELIAFLRVKGQPVPGLYGPSYEEQQAQMGG